MEVQGKKVAFLGDSITAGVGASELCYSYPRVFEKLASCEVFVDGISGSRIAPQKDADMQDRANQHFIMRAPLLPKDADIIVVFGGTNDFGHGNAPFGEFADRETDTFCGAVHTLCQTLMQTHPKATVIFMTPLHRTTEDYEINEIGLPRKKLLAYVEMIRRVCEYYALPVLDLYKVSGMQPAVQINRELYMPDGLHPSNAGAEKIAKLLYQFLLGL